MAKNATSQQRPARGEEASQRLLSVEEAQSRILASLRLVSSEQVELTRALGRICSDNIRAKISHPPAPVSAMDGYACRSNNVRTLPVRLRKIGVSCAGMHFDGQLTDGACVRIFTGAVVPDEADTIVIQENAAEIGGEVEFREVPKPGRHIRRAGHDFAAGQICKEKKECTLTARDIGLIAACGHAQVSVRRRPRVSILSTGDELVAPCTIPGVDQIVGSN